MTFDNLLYYPGHTHSPLRLTRVIEFLPTRSFSTSSTLPPTPPTQDEPTPIEPLCFYALTKNPEDRLKLPNRSWMVAVMLIGEEYEDEEGGKEDVMIRVATGYLRLEFERLLYPGAIIRLRPSTFEYAPSYESYTEFSSPDHLHVRQQSIETINVNDTNHQGNILIIPEDPTPTCCGTLTLSMTESNLRKGMVKINVIEKDDSGLQECDGNQVESLRKVHFLRRRSDHLQADGDEIKEKIDHGVTNTKSSNPGLVPTTPRHLPSSSKINDNRMPTWKGDGWNIMNKMDPRYRPFKDLVETRMVALEQHLMPSDDEVVEQD